MESRINELAHRLPHRWVSEPIDNGEYGRPGPLSIGRKINDEGETAFSQTKPMQAELLAMRLGRYICPPSLRKGSSGQSQRRLRRLFDWANLTWFRQPGIGAAVGQLEVTDYSSRTEPVKSVDSFSESGCECLGPAKLRSQIAVGNTFGSVSPVDSSLRGHAILAVTDLRLARCREVAR